MSPNDKTTRSFWLGSALSLILGVGLSAFIYWTLVSSDTNCRMNDVPCSELGSLELFYVCAIPAAVFLFIVLLGIRVRRHSPRAAAWLVSLPPAALIVYASLQASTMSLGG